MRLTRSTWFYALAMIALNEATAFGQWKSFKAQESAATLEDAAPTVPAMLPTVFDKRPDSPLPVRPSSTKGTSNERISSTPYQSPNFPSSSLMQVQSIDGPNISAVQNQKADPAREALRQEIRDYLAEVEAQKQADAEAKKKEKDAKGHEVGSDLNMKASWENGLLFSTESKDWRIHVGGRFQFQSVWWQQPSSLKGSAPGNGGIPASTAGAGVATLDDGSFFRRVRFRADGTAYENFEFVTEVDFEQLNYVTFDHMWFGAKNIPYLGTVRIGQHKIPQGLEMMASDYHQTFLQDRSALSEAFWTLFGQGVFIADDYFDQRVTFQTMFHRIQPTGFFTSDFGDGNYASSTRMTWTPLYENDGRCIVHIGGSYQWRHSDLGRTIQPGGTGNDFADSQGVVRFRARPELRDATGIGSIGSGVLGANTGRFVDTGFLLSSNTHTMSPEFLLIWGPFSVQAEAAWAYSQNVRQVYPTSSFGADRGSTTFWGGYVEASYFLTGEHRGYDRRFGTFDRPTVKENAFAVRGDDGNLHYGCGAWQIAYRYSYLDLNSNGVNGGQLGQHSIGVNWYINDNTKIQLQYLNAHRNVAVPANSGSVNGLGMLAQWYF